MRSQTRGDLAVRGRFGRVPRQYDEVDWRQTGSALAKALPDETSKPVAPDSQANLLLGNRETEARPIQVVLTEQYREKTIGGALSVLKHVIEVRCVQQA
ncbi:MAG: hypothetical protein Q8N51_18805 [Gammaproteobacteria bacterium]|nr:hypothetical protein [Gammaproteobacteria bacterium]